MSARSDIRTDIARESTAHKITVLRSQKQLLDSKLAGHFPQDGKSLGVDELRGKAEAMLTLTTAESGACHAVAKKAL